MRNLLSTLPRSSLLKSLRLASNLGVDFPSCLVRALGILGVDWKSETRLGLLTVSRSSFSFSSRYVGDLIFDTGVYGGLRSLLLSLSVQRVPTWSLFIIDQCLFEAVK